MDTHPKIKFEISEAKDVETFYAFVYPGDRRSLEWAILNPHPYFNNYLKDNKFVVEKSVVKEYVKDEYIKYNSEIQDNMKLFSKDWDKIKGKYFKLTDELFNKEYWPEGKYIAYPTVWGMYPRFINDSTFQIPANKGRSEGKINIIIAHEMLHFLFYNYVSKKFKEDVQGEIVWHASEIFNTIVQDSSKWIEVFGDGAIQYPEHENISKKLKEKYSKLDTLNTHELIVDILGKVKESGLD